jgi:membrane-associated protease RseP (regulator of RpoE activity)
MDYVIGVLVFAVGVVISIALHEVGHLVPAKLFGVRCTQYMIGFGRTIWSRKLGDTEYGLKAIPLGGYVRMLGMFPPKPGRPVQADTTGRWSLMVEQARVEASRELGPEDADRLFYQRSVPKRLIIMLGGPTMNLLLAVILLAVILAGFGAPTTTTKLSSISQCVIPGDAPSDRTCQAGDPAAPAARAGLKPGDVIVAFDGAQVSDWAQVRDRIRANHGTPAQVTVRRGDQDVTLTATPLVDNRPVLDAQGEPLTGSDGKMKLEPVGFLGVTPSSEMVPQPLTAVPGAVGDALSKVAGVVLHIPQKMVGVARAAFGFGERDPNGPISIVGAARVAGEIGSAQGTVSSPIGITDRIVTWLGLLASINMALFVFNLIPLLPLDGGQVAGALWEAVKRGFARLLRRPDPGPVDVARALPLAYGVASVLIGMSVLLIYADIVRPVRLGG